MVPLPLGIPRILASWIVLVLYFTVAASATEDSGRVPAELASLPKSGIRVVFPADEAYANASQAYNLRYVVKPVAIAYPTTTGQVSTVVKAGAALRLRVVARSGGHSYIANGLGGTNGSLVIDMSSMKQISYNPTTHHATIETGNRLGDIALALNAQGRALPHGRCTYVGIGGHSGFGGFGFVSRMWGLTLDTIQSLTVVLADGSVVNPSKDVHPDLFWALRGASPSFGIVTSITTQTFPAPEEATTFGYHFILNPTSAVSAITRWQDFTTNPAINIPSTLGGEVLLFSGAPVGFVNFYWFGGYYGSIQSFNETVKPYLSGFPAGTGVEADSFVVSGTWLDALGAVVLGSLNTTVEPDTLDTFYARSVLTPEAEPMTGDAIEAFVEYLVEEGQKMPVWWDAEIELYGGKNSAINSVPLDSTAFAHRSTLFNIQFYTTSRLASNGGPGSGGWKDEYRDYVDGMVSSIVDNMPEDWDYGAYMNYVEADLPDWQERYYGSHYPRLQRIKAAVDPHNVFQFPTSIEGRR